MVSNLKSNFWDLSAQNEWINNERINEKLNDKWMNQRWISKSTFEIWANKMNEPMTVERDAFLQCLRLECLASEYLRSGLNIWFEYLRSGLNIWFKYLRSGLNIWFEYLVWIFEYLAVFWRAPVRIPVSNHDSICQGCNTSRRQYIVTSHLRKRLKQVCVMSQRAHQKHLFSGVCRAQTLRFISHPQFPRISYPSKMGGISISISTHGARFHGGPQGETTARDPSPQVPMSSQACLKKDQGGRVATLTDQGSTRVLTLPHVRLDLL